MDKPHIDTINFNWTRIATVVKPLWLDNVNLNLKYNIKETTYRRLQEYYQSENIPKDLTKLTVIIHLTNLYFHI
jgi:1,2-phenylacetyl-CoA epoxidase catalytic subunit